VKLDDDAQWIEAGCDECGARFKLEAARVSLVDSEHGPMLVSLRGEPVSCPLHGSRQATAPAEYAEQWVNVMQTSGAFQA